MRSIDLTGRKFGYLTVLSSAQKKGCHKYWLCQCECGEIKEVRGSHLTMGKIKSCGCIFQKEKTRFIGYLPHRGTHHLSKTKIYRLYWSIKERCNNSKKKGWKDYGGRGIKLCEEWENNFVAFYEYIKLIYVEGKEIDRIDNNRGYEPGNVRFVNSHENKCNRRNTLFYRNIPLIDFCVTHNISYKAIQSRRHRGQNITQAVRQLLKRKGKER